jgi:hypothetical protein
MVVLLALASALTLAADNAVVAPQAATGPKPQATINGVEAVTIPQMLSYQGKLTDTLGQPVPNGSYPMMFLLYTVPSGGSAFWSENQSVTTKNGLFSVLLGSVTPIGSIPDSGAVYLGMTVSGGPELSPRLRIASAVYSYLSARSANSDLLQGKDTTGFVRIGQAGSVTSSMVVDGTVAAVDLGQMGASSGQVMKWTGSAWQPRNDSVGGGTGDNAWVRGTPDSVLFTVHDLGIARGGASNLLYGNTRHTHVNFGAACTTGTSGQNLDYCTVGGGFGNTASGSCASVSGGVSNSAIGYWSTVGGGDDNTASGTNATVSGGYYNTASGVDAVVSGGFSNTASDSEATVGGGAENWAIGKSTTVGGGYQNVASNNFSTIAGGRLNTASGTQATVGGGYADTASANNAVVGGGEHNKAAASYAVVGGGLHNSAGGTYSTTTGGYYCNVSGNYSTVIGGANDTCAAAYSLVAGSSVRARSGADYTFAFGEGCTTSVPRAVVFYHSGAATKLGVGVQTPTHYVDVTGGSYCDASGWHNGSSRALKKDIAAMTPEEMRELAAQLEDLEVVRFRYKLQDDDKLHVGVIAEDAPDVLVSAKHDALSTGDAIGFLLAVAKAQQAEIDQLKAELAQKR